MASPRLLKGRQLLPGHWFVVTTVTDARQTLFADQAIANVAIDELNSLSTQTVVSHAWVLMPDHLHWMFELRESFGLSRVMQVFKSRSAVRINRVRRRAEPVWQAGFHDHRLRNTEDFLAQARYIVANPLRRGLVERIEDYPHWWCRWIRGSGGL